MTIAEKISKVFREEFQTTPLLFRAPGRVNIIGEHTDYNDGFVLPAAIDKAAYIAISPSGSSKGRWISADFIDSLEVCFENIHHLPQHWANYLMGVVQQFQFAGRSVPPFNCVIAADVPIGSGLSSSAALETAVAFALNKMYNLDFDRIKLARLAQQAENEFIGLKCGIMDMFASLYGKKDHVMRLDCRSLEYQYFPLRLDQYKIVLMDTGVKHSLASSEYNIRREQCEAAVDTLQKYRGDIRSLRDVTDELLELHRQSLSPVVYRRCKFVLEENKRVFTTCEALQNGDLPAAGRQMYASHEGLQHEYEVSCPELDLLVDLAKNEDAVLGARMMGGGFGGCTINIAKESAIEAVFEKMAPVYKAKTGLELHHYDVITGDGAGEIK